MAFSFTLPELRAELRALGHDGLPDQLIFSVLSQLKLPLPSSSPLPVSSSTSVDSSGYDSEASFSSTHSLPCGFCSANESKTSGADIIHLSLADLVGKQPGNGHSCQESAPAVMPKDIHCNLAVDAAAVLDIDESPFRDKMNRLAVLNTDDLKSPALGKTNGEHTAHHNVGGHKLDTVSQSENSECTNHLPVSGQVSPDKIIERYWISVGEEHMRVMHSKSSNEENTTRNATPVNGIRETKFGWRSLKEKVEDCENELQRLTLRLQAQRCKKPWFLEEARKPRFLQSGKHDICTSNNSSQTSCSTSSSQTVNIHDKECAGRSESCVCVVSSADADTGNMCQRREETSLNTVQDCQALLLNMTMSEKEPEQQLEKNGTGIDALDAKPAKSLARLDHSRLQELTRPRFQKDTLSCRLAPDLSDEVNPSICSKSSSASYQHSRSSGDSRSNASQKLSTRPTGRRRQSCNPQQQPRRRCGKIDRVARFAEMQELWKKDAFLVAIEAGGKRKGTQSLYHRYSPVYNTRSC